MTTLPPSPEPGANARTVIGCFDVTDNDRTESAGGILWHEYRRRVRLLFVGSVSLVLLCGAVLAFYDPAPLAIVALLLIVPVYFNLRTKRRAAASAEASSFAQATVAYVTTSPVARAAAYGRRSPSFPSQPEGQLTIRPEGVGWSPTKMSARRGVGAFEIERRHIDSVTVFRGGMSVGVEIDVDGRATLFVLPGATCSRIERRLNDVGLPPSAGSAD